MSRLLLPLAFALVLGLGFVWFLPGDEPPPSRLEALREPLQALWTAPGDAALAEGRARALLKERLASKRLQKDEFHEAWSSDDPVLAWAAWLLVGDYGAPDPGLWDALRAALAPSTSSRVRAVAALAAVPLVPYWGDLSLRLLFERAVKDPDARVRASALQVLGQSDPHDPDVWRVLVEGLRDADGPCRDAAAQSLARVPFGDLMAGAQANRADALRQVARDEVMPALRAVTRAKRETVQMYAAMALGRMGPLAAEAVPDLVVLLNGKSALAQGHAATALGRIGEPALAALAKAAFEVPAKQIPMVLWALRLVGERAVPTLRDVMATHTSRAARVVAAMKLWELGGSFDGLASTFTEALGGSLEARLQAARGLQRIGSPASAMKPALEKARKNLGATAYDPEPLRRALDAAIESVAQ